MKRKSLKQLKKELDRVFSIWTRKLNSENGMNRCYCCGAWLPIEKLQAGHFVSRVHLATRWDKRNVKPCCGPCNIWRRGNLAMFAQHLIDEYGPAVIYELNAQSKVLRKMSRQSYEELILNYGSV